MPATTRTFSMPSAPLTQEPWPVLALLGPFFLSFLLEKIEFCQDQSTTWQ